MTSTASTRRRGSTPLSLQALLIGGFLLGVAATVLVVIFSDQVRWLRIGVLLALWAALCAAFAVARSRREAQIVSAREAEVTRTYQLELHREVAARREYESALTERVRTELDTKHADDLAGVRAQLERLTAALSNLLDGDVLVERLTLSAESTRLRGLTEAARKRLAGLGHPELSGQRAADDDAIDAELVDGEDAAGSDSAPAARPSAVPRPAAPSTGWTRRHRQDVVQAAAAVAADRLAREAAAGENAAREAAAKQTAAKQSADEAAAGHSGGHELDPDTADAGSSRVTVAQLLAALGPNAESSRGHRRAAD